MQHSNRQEQREQEYARQNKEYLEEKREALMDLKKRPDNQDSESKKKKLGGKFCCLSVLILTLLSLGLIYYFVINIKDSVYREWQERKKQVQDVLPQGKEEIKKSLDQGEALIDKTQETAGDLKTKYEKAEAVYQKTTNEIDQLETTKKKIEEVVK